MHTFASSTAQQTRHCYGHPHRLCLHVLPQGFLPNMRQQCAAVPCTHLAALHPASCSFTDTLSCRLHCCGLSQGFLPNVRQQRAAGYAAAELAQAVRALLAERAAGREGLWVNSEGASGQGGCSGRHLFGWRDAMDIVVK